MWQQTNECHLRSNGFRVQQHRIREAIRRIDPVGTIARRLGSLHRRKYAVAAPRSLYHMDGNHKLIRYLQASYEYHVNQVDANHTQSNSLLFLSHSLCIITYTVVVVLYKFEMFGLSFVEVTKHSLH